MEDCRLILGRCEEVLPTLEAGSIDFVFTDPPYPEIDRPYGRMTEAEWHALMRTVVPEVRRVLKSHGSAVFVLQPNSERVGRMRPWLFAFQAWVCREWNMVQDAWWWQHTMPPMAGSAHSGLLRPSLKACVWCGPPDCWRDQGAVLWDESLRNVADRMSARAGRLSSPVVRRGDQASDFHIDRRRAAAAAARRGGVTPFNVLPLTNADSANGAGAHGHGAGTPLALCDWWLRYLCPPGGTVLDPFSGSGTTGVAALKTGRRCVLIEKEPAYVEIARKRLAEAAGPLFATAGGGP